MSRASFVVLVVLCALAAGATADKCSKVKQNDLYFCYMVDYPVWTAAEFTLQDADEQAQWHYEVYLDDFLGKTPMLETTECANAIRSFKCAYVMHRCTPDGKGGLPPCKSTCNNFYDTCYAPEYANAMKNKNCIYMDEKEGTCTNVAIPPPPPPAYNIDRPPRPDQGLESVIFKDTFHIPVLGELVFGVKNLTVLAVEGSVEYKSKGRQMGLRAVDLQTDVEIQYFLIQKGFPWIQSHGTIHSKPLLNIDARFEFDPVARKFVYLKNDCHFVGDFETMRTGLKWIKDYFVSRWRQFILDEVRKPIEDFVQDLVVKQLDPTIGFFFSQGPFSRSELVTAVKYTREPPAIPPKPPAELASADATDLWDEEL